MKELHKTIKDIKAAVDTAKETQRRQVLENINNRIQEIEERISGAEDYIERIDSTVKNAKWIKLVTKNIKEIHDKMRGPNLKIIGIE